MTAAVVCSSGASVTPTQLDLPVDGVLGDYHEPYEGMSVGIAQELTATEVFTLGRFGEVDLSVGGRLDTPTNEVAPGAPAIALQEPTTAGGSCSTTASTSRTPTPSATRRAACRPATRCGSATRCRA